MRNSIDFTDATTAVPTGTVRPTRVRIAGVPVMVAVVVPFSPEDRAR